MGIEYSQEGSNKLWIGFMDNNGKPVSVSQRVADMILGYDVFPKPFRVWGDRPSEYWRNNRMTWPSSDCRERWGNGNYRYVMRSKKVQLENMHLENMRDVQDGPERTEIADGQYFRWTHAIIPHDSRAGLGIHEWGVVIIPHYAQERYIELMIDTIDQDEGKILDQIRRLNEAETLTVVDLFDVYSRLMINERVSDPQTFRDSFRVSAGERFKHVSFSMGERGQLPLNTFSWPRNTPEHQLIRGNCLDFAVRLDEAMEPYYDRRFGFREQSDVFHELAGQYAHILDREELREVGRAVRAA